MNVALGFDTYLVMRHGVPFPKGEELVAPAAVVPGTPYVGRLGCYYCNDIVAPMDVSSFLFLASLSPDYFRAQSLTDRTLDQMCTVTRPGIASIASSTAVELMVSILQHPKGSVLPFSSSPSLTPRRSLAPSDIPIVSSSQSQPEHLVDPATSSPLGIVPHQIRGFLAQFHNLKITGQAYDRCTGCSDLVRCYLSPLPSLPPLPSSFPFFLPPPISLYLHPTRTNGS